MKKLFLAFAILLSGLQASASETLTGIADDTTNLFCLSGDKLTRQKENALLELTKRIRMKTGICAWHSGDYVVETQPQFIFQDFGSQGCRAVASVQGSCR